MARRKGTRGESVDEQTAVFVSYSRHDAAFVEGIKPGLEALQLDVWLDLEDIPPSAKWRDEIQDGIERCEALIIIVSPDSATSVEVGKEIVRADELGKRIVPVLHREVHPHDTHPAVRDRNWVHWRSDDESASALAKIDESLKVDPTWTKEHTRLNGLALVWDRRERDRSLLVSGAALTTAEEALAVDRPAEQPQATVLMREFVTESRRISTRRQRRLVMTSVIVALVSISLAIAALIAKFEADRQRAEAVRQRDAATSTALASQSENRLAAEPDLSALLALEAYRTSDTVDALGSLLRVNDTATTFVDRFTAHSSQISAVTTHEGAGRFATGDEAGEVVLWDVAGDGSVQPRTNTIAVPASVASLAFDDTGERLTIAYDDGADADGVEIWEVPSDSADSAVQVDDIALPVGLSVLSADGTFGAAFVTLDDGSLGLGVVSVADGEFVGVGALDLPPDAFDDDEVEATSLVFSLDSSRVAFGFESEVHVWSWTESEEVDVIVIEELGIPNVEKIATTLKSVAFIDSNRIAFGIDEGDIYVTDIVDPSAIGAIAAQPASTSYALALTSITATDEEGNNTTVLASAHNNGQVKVWFIDGLTAFEAATLRGHDEEVHVVALTSSGAVISGSWDGDVIASNVFENAQIGKPIVDPETLTSHDSDVLAVEFVGNDIVASLGLDGVLKSWDPADQSATDVLEWDSVTAFGAAGDILAIGDDAGALTIVNAVDETSRVLEGTHDDEIAIVEISGDEQTVVSVDQSAAVWLWDVSGDGRTAVQIPDGFEPLAVTFPTSDTLWIGGARGDEQSAALRIDTSTGEVIEQALHHDGETGHDVTSIALSPDGTTLATGGSDRRIFLFDTADVSTAREELAAHLESVSDIVFLSDVVMFAGDGDGQILMWDVDAARPVGELTGPTDGINSLALDPDGDSLLAGAQDDRVWIWDLRVDAWIDGACELAGRNMTASEWDRFQLRGDPVNHCPGFETDDRPMAIYATAES